MKKAGANFRDQRNIAKAHEEGLSLEEISNKVNVKPEVCAAFIEHIEEGGELSRSPNLRDKEEEGKEPEEGNPPVEGPGAKTPAAKK